MEERKIIAVGGGKGGVGKSFVSANLAVTIARTGRRVVLFDADLGGANLHTLFGIHRPDRTVNDFLEGRASSLAEVAIDTGVRGVQIIGGTSDVLGSAELAPEAKRKLLHALASVDTDCLIIDVGAGTSLLTVDLFNAADTRLVVVAPELTSAQNAYGFLKVALYRRLQRAFEGHPAVDRLTEMLGADAFKTGSTFERVETFLSLVAAEGLDEPFRFLLQEFNAKLVGNMLAKSADQNVIWALKSMVNKFLCMDVDVVAGLRRNARVRHSVNRGIPIARTGWTDREVAEFERLACSIVEQDLSPIHQLRNSIADALSTADRAFEFGLAGVEIEIEEITDPVERAAIEACVEEERVALPPPPRLPTQSGVRPAAQPVDIGPVCVDVELGGRAFKTEVVSIDKEFVRVRGVEAERAISGAEGSIWPRFARSSMPPDRCFATVTCHSYDPELGTALLRFSHPPEVASFVRDVQLKWYVTGAVVDANAA